VFLLYVYMHNGDRTMTLAEIAKQLEVEEYMAQRAADTNNVPLRTLQDWCKKGLLAWPGQGTGNRRKFSVYDLILIGICKSLLEKGFKTELVRRAVNFFYHDHPRRLRTVLRSEYAWLLLPVSDDPKVSTGPNKFFHYLPNERPSAEEAMEALDPEVDATVTINIQRIAERVIIKISSKDS
jgi:DNA-binding transcriptional MerR regulator